MTQSFATFLTLFASNGTTVIARHQNRWPGQSVNGFTFKDFISEGIVSSRSGGSADISIVFPVSGSTLALIEDALGKNYLGQISLERFDVPDALGVPTKFEVVASFLGEVISASATPTSITMSLGSTLDPVEATAPPRRFTSVLAGRPPKL